MASSHRSDWLTARDEYFDTLDLKHPDHPYKEQLQKWRDQIVLEEAEGRARNLSSKVQTQFSEPHTNSERQYVSFDTLATKAADSGNEVGAAAYWQEMARVLKPDNPDERPWHLLAIGRANELETKIKERRTFVTDQLSRAEEADRAGRPNEAQTIRAMLRDKYGRYSDMADLLGTAPAQKPEPAPPPASPEAAPKG
jgi:serine/threonine-protein kinase